MLPGDADRLVAAVEKVSANLALVAGELKRLNDRAERARRPAPIERLRPDEEHPPCLNTWHSLGRRGRMMAGRCPSCGATDFA